MLFIKCKTDVQIHSKEFGSKSVYIYNTNPRYYDELNILHALGQELLSKTSFTEEDISYVEDVLQKMGLLISTSINKERNKMYIFLSEPDDLIDIQDVNKLFTYPKRITNSMVNIVGKMEDTLFGPVLLQSLNREITNYNIENNDNVRILKMDGLSMSQIAITDNPIRIADVVYIGLTPLLEQICQNNNFLVQKTNFLKEFFENHIEPYHILRNTQMQDIAQLKFLLMECGYMECAINKLYFLKSNQEAVVVYEFNLGKKFTNFKVKLISKSISDLSGLNSIIGFTNNKPKYFVHSSKFQKLLHNTPYICNDIQMSINGNEVTFNVSVEYKSVIQSKINAIVFHHFTVPNIDLMGQLERSDCGIGDPYDENKLQMCLKNIEQKTGFKIGHSKTDKHLMQVDIFASGVPENLIYFGEDCLKINTKSATFAPMKYKIYEIKHKLASLTMEPRVTMNFRNSFPQNISIAPQIKYEHNNLFKNTDLNFTFGLNVYFIALLGKLIPSMGDNLLDEKLFNFDMDCTLSHQLSKTLSFTNSIRYNLNTDNEKYNSLKQLHRDNEDVDCESHKIRDHLIIYEPSLNYNYDFAGTYHSINASIFTGLNTDHFLQYNQYKTAGITLKLFYNITKVIGNLELNSSLFAQYTPSYISHLQRNETQITNILLSNNTNDAKDLIGFRIILSTGVIDSMFVAHMPFAILRHGFFVSGGVFNKYSELTSDIQNLNFKYKLLLCIGWLIYLEILGIIRLALSIGFEMQDGKLTPTIKLNLFMTPTQPKVGHTLRM